MTVETPVVEPAANGGEPQAPEPKMFDEAYVKELRNEAASYRVKAKELEQKQKEAEDARLAEQNEWKTLAEQRAAEVEALKPYQQRYSDMVESVAESNTRRIASIPENMRQLVPDYDDPLKVATWLDANSQLLAKPIAPSLNGSAGNIVRPGEPVLSAEELEFARKMNITAEEYQKNKRG